MKTLVTVVSIAVIAILLSCSNSSSPSDNAVGTLKASFDGQTFTASLATTALYSSGVLAIAGSDSKGRQIQLRIIGAEKSGEYSFGGLTNVNVATVSTGPSPSQTYVSSIVGGSGTVTLNELSASRVSGTFTFTGINSASQTKTVTDGTFNLDISK